MGNINNISGVCDGCKAGLKIYLTKLLETYDINSEEITFFSYQHRQYKKIFELKPIDVFRCNNKLFGFSLTGKSNPKFINNKKISWKVFQLHQKRIISNNKTQNLTSEKIREKSSGRHYRQINKKWIIIILLLVLILGAIISMTSYLIINSFKNPSHDVIFNADGQAKQNALLENRQFAHSDLLPTGYFTNDYKPFTIMLKDGFDNQNVYLQIGQWGKYNTINNGQKPAQEFYKYQLTDKTTEIIPKIQGMIYLTNYSKTKDVEVKSITGPAIYQVPTFKIGKTDQKNFLNDVAITKSPFVEFISNHIFLTMQTYQIVKIFLWEKQNNIDIENILKNWDDIWKYTNEAYGLNSNYSGIAKKHQQYIHIANPDTGAGYASATNYHITFQNDTSAGADLFTSTSKNQWGLWHEIGHTYQTPQYQWNGLTEVTVNISALYVQHKLFNSNRLDTSSQITKIKSHFAQPDQQRNFDDISDLFTKLAMFWQLQMAFGDNFYPTLSQYYRLLSFSQNPATNVEKQQLFIEMTSQVSNRNLAPFFIKWGLPPTQATNQKIETYPALTKNIWENIIDGTHQPIVENDVVTYAITTADVSLKDNVEISFGTDINMTNYGKYFNYAQNSLIWDVGMQNYQIYQKDNDKYKVNVFIGFKATGKLPNKYVFAISTNYGDTIKFLGLANSYHGILGLDKDNKKIRLYGDAGTIHNYFGDKDPPYYHVIISDNNGTKLYDLKILGTDNFLNVIRTNNLWEGIKYAENYFITLELQEASRVLKFNSILNDWIAVSPTNKITKKYQIINNKLMEVN